MDWTEMDAHPWAYNFLYLPVVFIIFQEKKIDKKNCVDVTFESGPFLRLRCAYF